jgi:hypothetical protein
MVELQSSKLAMRVRFPLPAPFMNVCHELKTILWLPPRTATRAIAPLFYKFNFIRADFGKHIQDYDKYTHELSIPEGCEDYDIICTLRNPFSWMLSIWHWDNFYPGFPEAERLTFSQYIEKEQWELSGISKNILNAKITYPIRYEFMKQDLMSIPWFDVDEKLINSLLNQNNYKSENLKRNPENKNFSDYLAHYTKKELDVVRTKFSALFTKLGY